MINMNLSDYYTGYAPNSGPFEVTENDGSYQVRCDTDQEWTPIEVSERFAAEVTAKKLNDLAWFELGQSDAQDGAIPASQNSQYARGYESTYEFIRESRIEFACELMDRYPDSNPTDQPWSSDDFGDIAYMIDRGDPEYAVQYIIRTIWDWQVTNGIAIDGSPPGAPITGLSREQKEFLRCNHVVLP